jgi:hypothetical protein
MRTPHTQFGKPAPVNRVVKVESPLVDERGQPMTREVEIPAEFSDLRFKNE